MLDTNVVVSALLWRGTPYRLLAAIRHDSEARQLFSSKALLVELREVLNRPHLAKPLAAIGHRPADILADYAQVVVIVTPDQVPTASRDPDDDQVLACALAAKANIIVSGDDDLLTLGNYEGIPILTAAQTMQQFESNA